MKVLILAVVLTLVGCQQQNQQTQSNRHEVISYDYEFEIQNRISGKGFASAGMKVKCKVDIGQIDPDRKFMQTRSFEVFDYNGVYPWQTFIRSPKLTELFEREVKDVITFQHRNGHVEDIMAPAQISEFAFNILKGILNLHEYTLKIDQKNYNLRENGIEGKCNTTYFLRNSEKNDEFLVTKSKDLTDCDDMVLKVVGAAYAIPCKSCQQRNKNFQAASTYNYTFKDIQNGQRLLLEANSLEIRQFSPFNELNGGIALMEASQKMVFTGSQERLPVMPSDLKKFGSLAYNFKGELPALPIQLPKIKNREKEIEDVLQYLAGHSNEKFPIDGPIKFLELVQLFRTADDIDYFDTFFKRYSSQAAYRRVILDLIPAVGNPVAIRFLRNKMEHGELTNFEISHTLLVFFHFCNASQEVLDEAMIIVTDVLKGPESAYRRVITLGYGSLLNRYCSTSDVCPDKYLKPLTDFATKAAESSDIEGIVLALKFYGNVGHPAALKPIMKFIPNSASFIDVRIPTNAIMALRNIGSRDPVRIQGIALQIILNYKVNAEFRVLASMVLIESKPTLPLLMTLANSMLNEPSMQVENFVYTHLSAMAKFKSPNFHEMASASRVALKVLGRKIQQSAGYRFSRVFILGTFRESLMAAMGAKFVFIHKDGSMLPFIAIVGSRIDFLGHILFPLEVGITNTKLSDILDRVYGKDKDAKVPSDLSDLLKPFSDQQTAHGSFIGEGYIKMFGQEIMSGPFKTGMIREILQGYQGRTPFPLAQEFVDTLKNHNTLEWDKNLMSAEIHRAVPTCTGLPWQISLVHVCNTKLVGNVQLSITPEPTSQLTLPDMINSNFKLKTKLNLSILKDMILTMGIITPEMQAVLEESDKLAVNVPLNVDFTMNIKDKIFKVELPPCSQETDIFSQRLKTSAVTRNIEEAPASKSTPVLLPETMSNIIKQSFDSSSVEQDRRKEEPFSEIRSTEQIYSQKQSERHLDSIRQTVCFETCTFGCKVCFESANAYAGCILGDSLYNIIGEHVLKLTLKQDDTRAPIEKLQFTLQGGVQAAEAKVRLQMRKERSSSSEDSESSSDSSSSTAFLARGSDKNMNLKQARIVNEEGQQEHDQERYRDQKQPPEKRKKTLSSQLRRSSSSSSSSRSSSSSSSSSSRDSSSSDSSSDTRSKQHGKGKHQKYQNKKHNKNQSGNKRGRFDESKYSERPPTKYNEERERQRWTDLSPPRIRGLQWSMFSFKESYPNQEESSSSSSSSESSSSSSSSSSRRSSSSSSSSSSDSSQSQSENRRDDLIPYFTVVARALRSDNKDQGYNLSMYMDHESYNFHIKMIAKELAKTKWRACFDSQVLPYKFQSSIKWGKECRDYSIEMKASKGQVARHDALQMNMKWTKLPAFIREQVAWAVEYLPGIAYLSGFTAVYEKNPSRELMLRMIATTPYTTAMIFKIPGETFYRDSLCTPFILPVIPGAYYQPPQITSFNIIDFASWLAQGDQAVCEVGENRIVTFDGKIFNTTLKSQDCDLLVVQDCNKSVSYHPKFRIWTRKPDLELPREIHLDLNTVYIKVLPSLDAYIVLLNGKQVLVDKLMHEDSAAKIKIYRDNTTIAIEAPEHGLMNVTYDRTLLKVTVASRMKGHTCGLCGDNNGEQRNEGLMPNKELALNSIDYFRSWSSPDNCASEREPTSSESEKAETA
ncbi:vitellogenin-1-like isoform X2 [Anolis sagrei]|uniref:vitellogenin-1-like isoform X2 n=1 Tax=Anolis sagrei TaxID=38937 RepID=UPI003520FF90